MTAKLNSCSWRIRLFLCPDYRRLGPDYGISFCGRTPGYCSTHDKGDGYFCRSELGRTWTDGDFYRSRLLRPYARPDRKTFGYGFDGTVKGDLEVDEHHTIEDTAIALGEALSKALGDKRGIERYGYCLPMDDCLCSVALDFGGRPWLVWDAEFRREKVGDMPTEMFLHFFKSLSDAARMNLNIRAEGVNEHHKIEGIFKALARSIKMAIRRDIYRFELPSTKGAL